MNRIGALRYFMLVATLLILFLGHGQAKRPNILWLTCEDISPSLSMYGDSTANTPNLDRLATESMIFTEAFATVGVCSPARSSLITGMYPISIGTQYMRAGKDIMGWGSRSYDGNSNAIDIQGEPVPLYSVVTPPEVRCFTEYMRLAGYYCTNNAKTDYQFAAPITAWDENGHEAHWLNRNDNQPFFAVFNHLVTHESRLWVNADKPLTVDPEDVTVPGYLPDTPTSRKDIARNYSNIELLDSEIGKRLDELEKAGLLDSTIIFFFSDHGGPLPRGKREHYESGLRVPLMIRVPDQMKSQYIENLISFVDFAPTVLSLAGIGIPEHMQGQSFLGDQKAEPRSYAFGSGDRFGECSDRIRCVISKEYIYVRNFYPELPAYKNVSYRLNIPMMNEMLELKEQEKLTKDQMYWFREGKDLEEFYLRAEDPFSLNNCIEDPNFQEQVRDMRMAMDEWLANVGDLSEISEYELFEKMWPEGIQPKCPEPALMETKEGVKVQTNLEGSSVAYIRSNKKIQPDLNSNWSVYKEPIPLQRGEFLYVVSTRIGFEDSELVEFTL